MHNLNLIKDIQTTPYHPVWGKHNLKSVQNCLPGVKKEPPTSFIVSGSKSGF